jgi:hypothetical protein
MMLNAPFLNGLSLCNTGTIQFVYALIIIEVKIIFLITLCLLGTRFSRTILSCCLESNIKKKALDDTGAPPSETRNSLYDEIIDHL